MISFEGLHGIKATVLAHSINPQGIEFITYEIEYPRMVLAELNTHGMLVRNSASSRAIPFKKMIEQLTARPVRFGANNPGMQDKGEDLCAPVRIKSLEAEYDHADNVTWNESTMLVSPQQAWEEAKAGAISLAGAFFAAGFHKQVYNRLTEPFQMMKTVISGTEWNNFMWLRDHGAADPTIAELARVIKEARALSKPVQLRPGEWHLPYVMTQVLRDRYPGGVVYWIEDDGDERGVRELTLDEAIKVSSARCAAVSFRNVDYDVAKSTDVFNRLVGDERKHASAFQHQATPMEAPRMLCHGDDGTGLINVPFDPFTWEPGVSHVDQQGQLWSAQLRGWVMHRKLIEGENVPG